MHGNEHGNSVLVVKCTVRAVRDHVEDIGVRPDTLVKRMKNRLHGLCDSPFVGRIRIISTTVTETRMKSAVKTKAKNVKNNTRCALSLHYNGSRSRKTQSSLADTLQCWLGRVYCV